MRHVVDFTNLEDNLPKDFEQLLLTPFLDQYAKPRTKYEYKRAIYLIMDYFLNKRGQSFTFDRISETDAKEYFNHLSSLVEAGSMSTDCQAKYLSVCKTFGAYTKSVIPTLATDDRWCGAKTYENAFARIIPPTREYDVRTKNVLRNEQIDIILDKAKEGDAQFFVILILSFRMMLPQSAILSLSKENVYFLEDKHSVGVVTYTHLGKQVFARIPADVVSYIKALWETRPDGQPLFVNQRGNRLSANNLTLLVKKHSDEVGFAFTLGQLRTRGLVDIVSRNPDDIEKIEEYSGLSKRMLTGYGKAFDRISDGCIADKSGYKILSVE